MRNRAFTLIELLVVIGIIAILAAIAMPAFRGVQEKANGVKDSSNLRQIGIGFIAYLGDHDDTIFSTASTTGSNSWGAQLGPGGGGNYVADWHVFLSPFDKRPYINPGAGANSVAEVSYGINNFILTGSSNTTTSYRYPSALMILGPACTGSGSNLQFIGTTGANTLVQPQAGITGYMNNGSLLNVLFLDGHTATMKTGDFNTRNLNPSPGNQESEFWMPDAQ